MLNGVVLFKLTLSARPDGATVKLIHVLGKQKQVVLGDFLLATYISTRQKLFTDTVLQDSKGIICNIY